MKKMRISLILIAVVLIVFGWGAHKQKEQKQQINSIINEQQGVNQIEVKDSADKVVWSTKKEADQYKEQYPLSHVDKLEKGDRKVFAEDPDYKITYKRDNKALYSVEILRLTGENTSVSKEIQPFLFDVKGNTYVIYWPEQNKVLEQSENTQKLLNRVK
ncbi:hypothetical protein ACIQ4I_15105 [Rummeliibacillus sp. NPDC094406]|uniref:hypothetical protein n=1 Tax=Rummeliibacillus sp. NPDC094406 TaxID=3364511 RepID=UPI00380CF76D